MTTDRTTRTHHKTQLGKDAFSMNGQDTALRGASLAFGKPPVKPKPKINTFSGNNGALAAATKVGVGGREHERNTSLSTVNTSGVEQRLGYQSTGRSVVSGPYAAPPFSRQQISRLDSGGFLQPPGNGADQARSPSFMAATLAASRSASVSPNPAGQRMLAAEFRRQNNLLARTPSVKSTSSRGSSDPLDTTSIPPTTSSIGLFEKNAPPPESGKQPQLRRAKTVIQRAPTPKLRKSSPPTTNRSKPLFSSKSQKTPLNSMAYSPNSTSLEPSRTNVKVSQPLLRHLDCNSQRVGLKSKPSTELKPATTATKPIPIVTNSISPRFESSGDDSTSSDDSFVSASDYKPSFRAELSQQHRNLTSPSAVSVRSTVTVDSMANAIVASSLASSRAASPSKSLSLHPPPPPLSRRSPRSHLFHNKDDMSRTPSPAKQGTLRTTMRKPKPEESENEGDKKRAKKHLVKKHPNKHHEGDRKRWRDEITERERKRYEAVWASNKGLYTPSLSSSESSVCNLVVRDIYSRSRLHTDVLEEVYTLIDRQQNGRLEKEEFVVGLWLIDQRLKGRKLPTRVSDHVWRSVGGLGGMKTKKLGGV